MARIQGRSIVGLMYLAAAAACGDAAATMESSPAQVETQVAAMPDKAANSGSAAVSSGSAGASTVAPASTVTSGAAGQAPRASAAGNAAITGKPAVNTSPSPAGAAGSSGAGAAGSAGAGPATDASTASGYPSEETTPERADLGEGDGSDVIAIGDSWMNLSATGIQQSLNRASGQRYRTYGVPGTRLLNGAIPGQYASAKRADPDIKTVVMTGGGNDIIQVPGLKNDCAQDGERCAMVVGQILDTLTELWEQMAADGVQDVVYVQYSNPEGKSVAFRTANGDGVPKRCSEVPAPLRCHRLETLDIVMGDIPDGIHPSAAGFDRVGKALYELMVKEGMRR